jgi:hypothetical protein
MSSFTSYIQVNRFSLCVQDRVFLILCFFRDEITLLNNYLFNI